jgi:hypothetical protein
VKREAFILQLSDESQPSRGELVGWIEEVDTGHELRFRSTAELLAFLERCQAERRRTDSPPLQRYEE